MKFHENRLPADDSHEISCLICYFEIAAKFVVVGGALWVCVHALQISNHSAGWWWLAVGVFSHK